MIDVRIRRFADLAKAITSLPASCGPVRLVAVDGPGGAGKTTFAQRLSATLTADPYGAANVSIVHTDDFASWENQFGWAPRLRHEVIDPLQRGEPACFQRYDWVERRLAEWHEVPADPVVIVEGVGAAQAFFRDAIAFAIWIQTPPDVRLARGLARDGEHMLAFWQQWIAGENIHFATDATLRRASLVVMGDPSLPHDPAIEFVEMDPRIS